MPEPFVLRSTLTSPFGRKVRMAADVLKLTDRIALLPADPRDDNDTLRKQNPLGKMPCLLLPDGTLLVSTNRAATGSVGPSKLFRYSARGAIVRTYTISGQDLAHDHGTMSLALDAQGRVYVADYAPPRALRFAPQSGVAPTRGSLSTAALVVAAEGSSGSCRTSHARTSPWWAVVPRVYGSEPGTPRAGASVSV